ncbi:MAG: bifunctional phosphoribosylaminoimidazolecarboxamide formyltransferase/IMP cyclohydrolase [Clostridiales Family XIII bacterium]|jgi:phosphoribosylaminoimidazolecarboxamide formyltransferase/IMP cyclohydrolase|nr:bifunctional phosphoribosylaminoimidazolecarboxamide formyltransferase/IMP cyclohydrolase [Clostridiales Family XIII bacterium]
MRALISVSDKTGVIEFAKALEALDVEIISTGGTYKALEDAGVKVTGISDVTGFPECLDGRVKTLHPAVHGGILAMREKPEHMQQIKDLGIETIDVIAINLYPFKQTIRKPDVTLAEAIENIDIGGPTMLRSAAKNHKDVLVICDPKDYTQVITELKESGGEAGGVSYDTKYRLALKVFEHTASYDAMIAEYLRQEGDIPLPENPTFTFEKIQDLRYGENPHQHASYYAEVRPRAGALVNAKQLHGKELSFNNINDTNGALDTLREFDEPTVVAVKHANPCGVGSAGDIHHAYLKAYEADPVSIFGGIVAANRIIDAATAEEIGKIFVEIVIAPGFTDEAQEILTKKPSIRLLALEHINDKLPAGQIDIKKIDGGLLIQDKDLELYDDEALVVVTKLKPTEKELEDLKFAMKVVKHTKSNAIVIAYDKMTLGVGPGQTNRIGSVEIAVKGTGAADPDADASGEDISLRDLNGSVLASDAFFPFDDCVTAAAAAGIKAIIQPGGSVRDEDSIKRADELGIAMVFTGVRHFKH